MCLFLHLEQTWHRHHQQAQRQTRAPTITQFFDITDGLEDTVQEQEEELERIEAQQQRRQEVTASSVSSVNSQLLENDYIHSIIQRSETGEEKPKAKPMRLQFL